MRNLKRVLLVVCVCFFLTGCTRRTEKGIVFAVGGAPNEIDFWEDLIREFKEEEGIEIRILRQPTDTDQRRQGLLIPLKSKQNDPDIFLMDVAWIAQFAASGWLEPLDHFCAEDKMDCDVFFKKVIRLADWFDGDLVALPLYIDAGLLYYRQDLLEGYGYNGPPGTWMELVDWSRHIQGVMRKENPDFFAFVWQGAQYEGLVCNFLEFAGSNGGGIVIQDGRIRLKTPQNIKSTRFMYDLIHTYGISPPNTFTEMKEEEVRIFFQQGKALFARNWPYAWPLYQAEGSRVKDRVGIAPLPHFPSGESISTLGGWHIGISRYSDAKSLSWKFVRFAVSFEAQKRLAMGLGWNPARRDVYEDQEVLQEMPHFATLGEVFQNAQPRPNLPYYSQISEVLQEHLNAILAGKSSPEKGLEEAESEAQKIMDRYSGK
ncbi:MAG: ABC transporter substrate-binding protein [bacterium]